MRISLDIVNGISTFIEQGKSIEKKIPTRAMLVIAHRLYHNGWNMAQEVDGDTVTRIVMMNPIMVIAG
jgi:hypothetical protein